MNGDRKPSTSPLFGVIVTVCLILAAASAAKHADAVFKAQDLRNQESSVHVR